MASVLGAKEALQEGIALGADLHGERIAFAGLFGEPHGVGTRAIALIPRHRDVPLHPGRIGLTELLERRPQRFQDPFQPVEGAHSGEYVRGIRALRAPRLNPPAGFAGRQEGIQEPLGTIMRQQALAKIV
jgi:hypothetical protein